ncbi:MAG: transglutaminase-like domain-containing protein [Lacipirellulaceae bacterium]
MPLLPTGPAYCRPEAYAHFEKVLEGRELDEPAVADKLQWLFEAAWALARHDMPQADFAAGETAVENLAEAVRKRIRSTGFEARIAHLHDLLFEVIGLSGNTDDYYNPSNSYLPAVLQSRQGIPITLALVYGRVAAELELEVYGVNAPGHFLVEVVSPDEGSMYVDPFYGGGIVTSAEALARIAQATGRSEVAVPGCLVRASARQWLSRMLFNLQAVFAATGRERDVYAMQELQDCLGRF